MRTRRAYVDLIWNGAAVAGKMSGYQKDVTYTDPASGEADSIDVSIHDRGGTWIGPWFPETGDTLAATIKAMDWAGPGDTRILPCGSFVLDNFNFSGWPIAGTISGVSVPADSSFRETERSKTWENVTVEEIGKEIAGRAGVSLSYDVGGGPIQIKTIEQSERTDCDFYMELCSTYGLAMKVYSKKIVVFDREAYKAKGPAATITPDMIQSWNWDRKLAGTYTGGEYTYTDPGTEEEIKVNVGEGPRILKVSGKADNKADAERKIKAAVANANHDASKMSVTIMGTASLVASQCVAMVGLGKLSGKYYIDQITHHIGGSGYTFAKVPGHDPGTDERSKTGTEWENGNFPAEKRDQFPGFPHLPGQRRKGDYETAAGQHRPHESQDPGVAGGLSGGQGEPG